MQTSSEPAQPTRRSFLTSSGLATGAVAGALALGSTSELIAIEATEPLQEEQPGDAVGSATRAARIRDLASRLGDDPVVMLNLLKFKPGGLASYQRYGQEFQRPRDRYAPETRVLFAGRCEELLIGDVEWDMIILVQYPSVAHFSAVVGSREYAEISHYRTAAIERSVLYACVSTAVA